MDGTPRAVDAQFWVLLAGVILSHTGPLINGSIVGSSLRDWLRMLKLHQTHREKTMIIWSLSMAYGKASRRGGGELVNGWSIWGRWLIGKKWGLRMILVHSRELIHWGRKQKKRREAGGWRMLVWGSMKKLFLFFCWALAECRPSNPLSELTVRKNKSDSRG